MGRYLKPNASNETPSHCIAVDVESFTNNSLGNGEFLHKFRLGTYWYLRRNGDKWSKTPGEIKTIEAFWGVLDSYLAPKRRVYVIGHNMRYDYGILNLDEYLSSREMTITKFVIEQVFIVAAIGKDGKHLVFIDTKNWFNTSLEKIGKAFGMVKGEIKDKDFDNATDGELLPYCYTDSEIVAKIFIDFIQFIKDYDLGNFGVTAATQAFNAYRHRFMKEHSILLHGRSEFYDLEQKTYRGGRTDIFRQGSFFNIIKLDINSMYPFVMKYNEYPVKPLSRGLVTGVSVDTLETCLVPGRFVIADCDIEICEQSLGVKRDKLIFPIGKIKSAYLTTPEIKYVLKNGIIHNVNSILLYESANIFSDYVDFFYEIKSNSTGHVRELSKLFLNALYGKFGQRKLGGIHENDNLISRSFFAVQADQDVYFDHDNNVKVMKIGDRIYSISPKKQEPSYNASPVISSAVTAYARQYLWELFKICGLENLYYCDTDSIFTNRLGYDRLDAAGYIDSKELGKLKVEGIGDVDIRAPKDYDWYDVGEDRQYKRTIKGVPGKAILNEAGQYVYDQWVTGYSKYREPKLDGIKIKTVKKTIAHNYDKGTIDSDGYVHPFILEEF